MYNPVMNDDVKYVLDKNGRQKKLYKANCPQCGTDTGYNRKERIHYLCKPCKYANKSKAMIGNSIHKGHFHSKESREKMSKKLKGKSAWNKDIKMDETFKEAIKIGIASKNDLGNRGKWTRTNEHKIKTSCRNRKIDTDSFDGFTTPVLKRERNKFKTLDLSNKTFIRDDHACQCCSAKGTTLHAHHMNSFAHYPEQRFELNNLVTLCNHCHNLFHKKYGNGKATPNTKEQFLEFKAYVKNITKKDVILLCGAPASGKSWVGKQLTKYSYISHDDTSSKNLIYSVLNADKPVIYDPTIGISTFMKNMSHYFNFKLVVIIEDEDVIKSRMLSRDGKITPTIEKRCKRMRQLSKKAIFSGTSEEVLKYLQV